jgi:hypothetical protein
LVARHGGRIVSYAVVCEEFALGLTEA